MLVSQHDKRHFAARRTCECRHGPLLEAKGMSDETWRKTVAERALVFVERC
jgi:hypothetical protein